MSTAEYHRRMAAEATARADAAGEAGDRYTYAAETAIAAAHAADAERAARAEACERREGVAG